MFNTHTHTYTAVTVADKTTDDWQTRPLRAPLWRIQL